MFNRMVSGMEPKGNEEKKSRINNKPTQKRDAPALSNSISKSREAVC